MTKSKRKSLRNLQQREIGNLEIKKKEGKSKKRPSTNNK